MPTTEFDETERRSKVRYPFTLDLRYRALAKRWEASGEGATVNLSSRGALIAVAGQSQVAKGLQLEVSMKWPILLNGAIPLQLTFVGRVVRSDPSTFAVSFSAKGIRFSK
jgi:hypothetical protein